MPEHQLCIGLPKMRKSMPAARKCEAIDNPYGPAPMMMTFVDAVMGFFRCWWTKPWFARCLPDADRT